MSRNHQTLTDQQLSTVDVLALLSAGLPSQPRLFGEGAIAAAIEADRHGVQPASIAYLAEVVRAGGVPYAAELPEPLPTRESAELARAWLTAAAAVTGVPSLELGEAMARWLEAVAMIVDARRRARGLDRPSGT